MKLEVIDVKKFRDNLHNELFDLVGHDDPDVIKLKKYLSTLTKGEKEKFFKDCYRHKAECWFGKKEDKEDKTVIGFEKSFRWNPKPNKKEV